MCGEIGYLRVKTEPIVQSVEEGDHLGLGRYTNEVDAGESLVNTVYRIQTGSDFQRNMVECSPSNDSSVAARRRDAGTAPSVSVSHQTRQQKVHDMRFTDEQDLCRLRVWFPSSIEGQGYPDNRFARSGRSRNLYSHAGHDGTGRLRSGIAVVCGSTMVVTGCLAVSSN